MLSHLIVFSSVLLSTSLFAGWVSGGGELVRNTTNPWFIQNTKVINACILFDSTHFHRPDASISLQQTIEIALQYWRSEFEFQADEPAIKNFPKLATQSWRFSECSDDTDVKFQFGVLTPDQLRQFKENGQDPRNFISAAIRTSYDKVKLKAKGFIYISPDSGPLKPRSSSIVNQPWAYGEGGILTNVLAHELGHIYGVPHLPGQNHFNLMSANAPSVFTSEPTYQNYAYNYIHRSIFKITNVDFGSCRKEITDAMLRFLVASNDSPCFAARWSDKSFRITGHKDQTIGTVTLGRSISRAFDQLIYLWLPPEQQFVQVPQGSDWPNEMPIGPIRYKTEQYGIYRDAANTVKRSVILTNTAGVVSLSGILDSGDMIELPPF